ncbi:MAG TPA: FAD/NAD(P)-binding protein [Pirellulales bacterium]|nr:FAD/NAD(P)-binding protein [Pirellulales bacterium]
MKTIAIIGGGFCGAITAVNLARFHSGPLRVVIVNDRFPTGRGVAYSTMQAEHLLNVAARNMSALADHPNHFVEWLRTRHEYANVPEAELRETFIPRRVYGDYLRSLLAWHEHPLDGAGGMQIEERHAEAVDVVQRGQRVAVVLADGDEIVADKVLLATGNQPPGTLPMSDPAVARHPGYFATPWEGWQQQLADRSQDVVLLGTGLTTVDAVLTLLASDWRGQITAVSRHGLLPRSHFKGIEYPDFPPADIATMRLPQIAALLEEHYARLRERGQNPAIVVDKLRPHTQRIWQGFSLDEKHEFCRRYAAQWNVIRHRIAQQIHQRITHAIESGKLRVISGTIDHLEPVGDRLRVVVHDGAQVESLLAGVVVNCTGPSRSFSASSVPLFRNLLANGMIAADEMDMGLRADADFTVIDGRGERSEFLYAMGPLLHGTLWETIAVPELRGQALRVAQLLLEACEAKAPQEAWPAPVPVDVLEYCI